MNARYYVPYINRFASADSIVPEPGSPQSYNRYSYSYNNPLKYTDPSGHCAGNETDPEGTEGRDDACWTYLTGEFCDDLECGADGWKSWVIVGDTLSFLLNDMFDSRWTKGQLETLKETILTAKEALINAGVTNWRETVSADLKFSNRNAPEFNGAFGVNRFNPDEYGIELFSGMISSEASLYSMFAILHEIARSIDYQSFGLSMHYNNQSFGNGPLAPSHCFRQYACDRDHERWADAFAIYAITSGTSYGVLNVNASILLETFPDYTQGQFDLFTEENLAETSNDVEKLLGVYVAQ